MLLKDAAYKAIKDFLFRTADPAEAYSERALATTLGLGLAPVRSAVERLRSEGMISVGSKAGIRMPEVGHREIIDFFEFRRSIETFVVTGLAGRLNDGQFDRLEELLVKQEVLAKDNDPETYHLDLEFHMMLAGFHGNAEMVRALGQLTDKMYRLSLRLHRAYPDRLGPIVSQHREIVEALREGDAEKARRLMDYHLGVGQNFTVDPDGRMTRR